MKTRSEHRQSELHRLAGPAPSRIRSQSRWQLTCLPRSQSVHHTLKLERVYFRINKRNLLLGAILWSLLSLCSRQRRRIASRKDLMSSWGVEGERAVKGGQGGAGKLTKLLGLSPCRSAAPLPPGAPPHPSGHKSRRQVSLEASAQFPVCGIHSRA